MTREFTGCDMLLLMVSFFGVVISVNVGLAVMANRSWTGLVVENSYVASQHFDDVTARLVQSERMDVHPVVEYAAGKLSVSLHDSAGAGVMASNVMIRIGRPSHEGEDRTLQMNCPAPGQCAISTQLAAGVWSGEVDADLASGKSWKRMVRLFVKG